jgi:hypothetical protein
MDLIDMYTGHLFDGPLEPEEVSTPENAGNEPLSDESENWSKTQNANTKKEPAPPLFCTVTALTLGIWGGYILVRIFG